MPTKAFYKLDMDKQKRIIESAKQEFSENFYEDASINKIIKEINMPRGSFYLYFENKEDLYLYILELYLKEFKKILLELLEKNNHNIFESFISIYDYIVDIKTIEKNLIDKIFINMNSKRFEYAIPELLKKEVDGSIINSIKLNENSITEDDANIVMSILIPILFINVSTVLSEPSNKNLIREFYIKQINIIRKGLERK